ncbi:DUF3368 domain-containing protein [Candidatus Woesearchaeota archaeon]|nr:DUF3368 domain-containing protein [Candidatus Woesearchaeota archaeon]
MILNASPLIIFGRLNNILLLKRLFGELIVAPEVYREVVISGKKGNAPDAPIIESHISKKEIVVISPSTEYAQKSKSINEVFGIDYGESETIALALQRREKKLVIDEMLAREAAKAHGLEPLGSLGVLALAKRRKLLSVEQVKALVAEMSRHGFRLSPEVLMKFWNSLER